MISVASPETRRYIDVLSVLTARNVKLRYRGSALGVAWSLVNPLIMTFVYTAVFGHAFSQYYRGSALLYMLAVFIGLVSNGFFASATSQALHSVVSSSGLINKVRTPPSVYPMAQLLSSGFQLVAGSVPLLIVITLVFTHSLLNAVALAVPLLALALLATGVGYVVSALYVFFRDVPYMYELVLFATWVATPVFYPLAIVGAQYRPIIEWNPLTQVIETIRALALGTHAPTAFGLLMPLGAGVLAAAAGWAIFRRTSVRFMDYL